MLKLCSCLFILVLPVVTVETEARPNRRVPVQTLARVSGANDSKVTLTKKISTGNVTRDGNNRTKTRILVRGDLFGEELSEQDIIFPDTYQIVFDNIPRIDGPPKCAKGNTFCENVDSYPYHQLQNILNRNRIHTDLFGEDELPPDYFITNRNSAFESFICTSIQKTIFPRVGKNKNNKWKYIINQEEEDGYVQGIRIEICKKEGSPCDLIGERINGYVTSCKQKYMLRRLMSISESGDPKPDTFQLPSACCCSYKKDLSFLSSLGAEEISARTKIKNRP